VPSLLYFSAVFIPATSENILVSAMFSRRHRDTLADLAIVFSIKATIKMSEYIKPLYT